MITFITGNSTDMTLAEIEAALDAGNLEIEGRKRWYKLRRNGTTKRWVRDPLRFRIPCKYGFAGHYAIYNGNTAPLRIV